MGDRLITFEGVWKRFRRGPAHDSLRDLVPGALGRLVRGNRQVESGANADRTFWALRDVSFTVAPGEALGIIGGNGAGKSTALKLLNRILQPTRGTVSAKGRLGALIEVAAGFHPDLTGRENVFLQGAIMGMPQRLIRQRFDDIVEFSGVSDFIDTPVKRYSSGMNARLGFSIAAHLEPDALLIDEVLSVGDAGFQKRAFERIKTLVRDGIPAVVVSHQLDKLTQLCERILLLERGAINQIGNASEVVNRYLMSQANHDPSESATLTGPVVLEAVSLGNEGPMGAGSWQKGTVVGQLLDRTVGDSFFVEVWVTELTSLARVFHKKIARSMIEFTPEGKFTIRFSIHLTLPAGLYRLEFHAFESLTGTRVAAGIGRNLQVVDESGATGSHYLGFEVLDPPAIPMRAE